MRALQKIVRNGNSAQFTIPRALLIELGWLPGESVIIELLEDRTLRLRRPVVADFLSVQRGTRLAPATASRK